MGQAEWARDLARQLLEKPLPRRRAHTQGVAARAETLAPILGEEADLLTASAWLHDIGYAPELVDTGFHPLDGARYLRDVHQADGQLARLVAHHSCAVCEATERGLLDALNEEFDRERPELVEALTYCDMTTSPDGLVLDVDARLTEVHSRYGPEYLVSRSISTRPRASSRPCAPYRPRRREASPDERTSDDMTPPTGCYSCEQEAQFDVLPPRERVAFDEHWRVVHAINTALPGWLVLVPRRHVTAIAALTDAETATLGAWQVRLSRALHEVTGCMKTYVVQFAELEGFQHVHFHVVPRMSDLPRELRGRGVFDLLGHTGEDAVSADQMDEIAVRLGRSLQ